MSGPTETAPDPGDAFAPLDRWLEDAQRAPIPRSARSFAPELHAELREALGARRDLATVAADLKDQRGTGRRERALRILDRVGLIERALRAYEEERRRLHGS